MVILIYANCFFDFMPVLYLKVFTANSLTVVRMNFIHFVYTFRAYPNFPMFSETYQRFLHTAHFSPNHALPLQCK